MAQITKRFTIDRHGSSDAFVLNKTVRGKKVARQLAAKLRKQGNLVRVTKAKRKGLVRYDVWVY
jgi:hypothetical protein